MKRKIVIFILGGILIFVIAALVLFDLNKGDSKKKKYQNNFSRSNSLYFLCTTVCCNRKGLF